METLRFKPDEIWVDSQFPKMKALDGILIPSNGNLVIADVPLPAGWEDLISNLSKDSGRTIRVVDATVLTEGLNMLLPPIEFFGDGKTALLFPGRGAARVLDYLTKLNPVLIESLKTNRALFRFDSLAQFPNTIDFSKFRSTFIVDDVVVTGSTATRVAQATLDTTTVSDDLYYTRGWQPKRLPIISTYSWLSLDPSKRARIKKDNIRSPSSIDEVADLSTCLIYQGNSGLPPCNSLSTLVEGGSKSQAVFEGLKNKYFPTNAFDNFINLLKESYEKQT